MDYLLAVTGIALLWLGGEALVRGAVRLAGALGVRPLVVGLTVVAFGTSSPELAASVVAAFRGANEVVLGNVVGSNILNLGLVLGVTAVVRPLTARRELINLEFPLMIIAGLVLLPLGANGRFGLFEGMILVALLGLYLLRLYRVRRPVWDTVESPPPRPAVAPGTLRVGVLFSVVGIGLLVAGAQALVVAGLNIAHTFGISERLIGLTLVAVGTSLPELASSLVAALRGESDLVLGNLVGSSVFNVLAILGLTTVVRPILFDPQVFRLDVLIMTGFGLLTLGLLAGGRNLLRWQGGVLLSGYMLYLWWLFR